MRDPFNHRGRVFWAWENAVKELLFLRQVWCFMLPGKGMSCFSVFEDNQGAVQLVGQNTVTNSSSKHILTLGHSN